MASAAAKSALQEVVDRAHELAEANPVESLKLYKQAALSGELGTICHSSRHLAMHLHESASVLRRPGLAIAFVL